MREFFDRLNMRIAEFMNGRYGMDHLNKFLFIAGIIIVFVGSLITPVDYVGWILVVIAIVRALSKNPTKRVREDEIFMKVVSKPKKTFSRFKLQWSNRKTTVYFKCGQCGQHLSVPKGKGKIRIICPKCGKEINKTT